MGRGIVKNGNNLDLFIGITLHDALAAIATFTKAGKDVPIDEIAKAAYSQIYQELAPEGVIEYEAVEYAEEQATLVEGIVRGVYKHVWPRFMSLYPTIIAVEAEMGYLLADGFKFMTKPDLVVESTEGELVYIEYKSTSSKKPEWITSWETAVQLHSSVKATEATLGRPVLGVQIVGMYKGYESYGKQSSPFCYAYKRSGNPPFTQDQVEYAYKAGFKRSPTWKMDGGVASWVDQMPDNILATQFPLSPIILPNDDLVAAFFRQRLIREREIATFFGDEDIDRVFPQHFDQCKPAYGWACPYTKLCHGYVDNPLNEGYVWREPHHEEERVQFAAQEEVSN